MEATISSAGRAAGQARPAVHWTEALLEALGLGLFMISAGAFGTLFENPASPVRHAIPDAFARRALMGLAMGATAIGLIYSPWGRRSGAHINPATTLTFFRLGRVRGRDAAAYLAAQVAGGLAGVLGVAAVLGEAFLAPPVGGVATIPGSSGLAVAFIAELGISFLLMLVVLSLGGTRLARYTGLVAGAMVCLYIIFEAPLSGMSMNPARTLASAIPTSSYQGLWIYLTAPVAGMLLASEAHVRATRPSRRGCAKLFHALPCVFCGGQPSDGDPRRAGSLAGRRGRNLAGRTT
jgi:aquaporin Z